MQTKLAWPNHSWWRWSHRLRESHCRPASEQARRLIMAKKQALQLHEGSNESRPSNLSDDMLSNGRETCANLFGKHVANGSLSFALKHRLKAILHPPMFAHTSIHAMRCNLKKNHDTSSKQSKCLASCSLPMISSRQCYDSPNSFWNIYSIYQFDIAPRSDHGPGRIEEAAEGAGPMETEGGPSKEV